MLERAHVSIGYMHTHTSTIGKMTLLLRVFGKCGYSDGKEIGRGLVSQGVRQQWGLSLLDSYQLVILSSTSSSLWAFLHTMMVTEIKAINVHLLEWCLVLDDATGQPNLRGSALAKVPNHETSDIVMHPLHCSSILFSSIRVIAAIATARDDPVKVSPVLATDARPQHAVLAEGLQPTLEAGCTVTAVPAIKPSIPIWGEDTLSHGLRVPVTATRSLIIVILCFRLGRSCQWFAHVS